MICTIQWRTYTRVQWSKLLVCCPHSSLLQSYYYAQAMRAVHKQGVRHGLIQIDGKDAGIVQMQEVKLFGNAIHGLSIDRGPLWFDGFGKMNHIMAFTAALNEEFPQRMGRKRRFIPEFSSKKVKIALNDWKKSSKTKEYETILLDISVKLDILRENLRKNWRNSLSKAEKQPLSVDIDTKLESLSHFLQFYMQDRLEKGYAGASPKFLASLCQYATMAEDCYIMNATEDDEIIASILVFTHGKGATYQAGWTTPYGRDKCAHQLLLWRAIGMLRDKGVTTFDLGGYNDDSETLRHFKDGLGGQQIALIGSYS